MYTFLYISAWKLKNSFTLVELLITIVILSILGVIGLATFTGYNSNARDSTRVEDLANIQKSLAIYTTTTGNRYPLPDNGVPVYSG